ncbi:type II toxin-antitoxin system Phd/YefM family antitoxin [Pseudomonas brassicacearum]|uniref:type II toxin-antitoxin system Phd/YefM family antitoxin n=1 Tax=Pseudomonas brassicacearum TaxID=930166 RepID=UPI00161CBE07|nr:hypothetical protein [Pseudomonas brassicacearum]
MSHDNRHYSSDYVGKPASEASVVTLRGIAKAKDDDKGDRMSDDAKSVGARAWEGDRVMITKADKPHLDLLPHADTPQVCKPGRLKGKIRMSADFDNTRWTSSMDLKTASERRIGYSNRLHPLLLHTERAAAEQACSRLPHHAAIKSTANLWRGSLLPLGCAAAPNSISPTKNRRPNTDDGFRLSLKTLAKPETLPATRIRAG